MASGIGDKLVNSEPSKHTFNITQAAEELVPNKINRNLYLFSLLMATLLVVVALYFYPRLPERIPVFLTATWGESRLGGRFLVFGFGVVVILTTLLNLTLGRLWSGQGSLIPRILSITSTIFAVAMCLAMWGMLQSFFL